VISWAKEFMPDKRIKPPKDHGIAKYEPHLDLARKGRAEGYETWLRQPNPGIEPLFLPYMYRTRHDMYNVGGEVETCLESSYKVLTMGAPTGLFDALLSASWDDSGLHNQIWMMQFANAAAYGWNGSGPELDEFIESYFPSYYGAKVRNGRELFSLLSRGAYFYWEAFERKCGHGKIYRHYRGMTRIPDLPRDDGIEYDPCFNVVCAPMIERSVSLLRNMDRALQICRDNMALKLKHGYDFEVFASIAELIRHNAATYLALSELEKAVEEAQRNHFVDRRVFRRAVKLVEDNLAERERVYCNLVMVWEKTRLPKGINTPEKKFFHETDRAQHFANARPDMSYLICDEEKLGLERYLADLKKFIEGYSERYLAGVE
jgi:hypothetical protein